MTEDKARNTAIRTRMAKSGESNTAARRHMIQVKDEAGPATERRSG